MVRNHWRCNSFKVPPGLRSPLLMSVASFRPNPTIESSFAVGEFRAAFAEEWEQRFSTPVPVAALHTTLNPPIPIRTVIEFNKFGLTRDASDIDAYLATLMQHLADQLHTATGQTNSLSSSPTRGGRPKAP